MAGRGGARIPEQKHRKVSVFPLRTLDQALLEHLCFSDGRMPRETEAGRKKNLAPQTLLLTSAGGSRSLKAQQRRLQPGAGWTGLRPPGVRRRTGASATWAGSGGRGYSPPGGSARPWRLGGLVRLLQAGPGPGRSGAWGPHRVGSGAAAGSMFRLPRWLRKSRRV